MQKVALSILLYLVLGQCWATSKEAQITTEIKNRVQTAFPQLSVDAIVKSPVSGLYELTAGPAVLYASANGRYLVTGDVWDLDRSLEEQNLTEETRRKLRSNLLEGLHHKEMIIYKPTSETKGVVTVFTDPDCGYCKKLHAEIPKLSELGIELRYVAFPRQGIGSPTYTKMVGVWCAGDPKLAMAQAMQGGDIETVGCQHSIGEHLVLGEKLGISATPALVFSDGTLVLGYFPPHELAEKAKKHQRAKKGE